MKTIGLVIAIFVVGIYILSQIKCNIRKNINNKELIKNLNKKK
jgi:hypothetical protein